MLVLANYPISEITSAIAKTALDIPYNQGKAEIYRKSIKLLFLIPFNPCEKIATTFNPLKKGKKPCIKPDKLPAFFMI